MIQIAPPAPNDPLDRYLFDAAVRMQQDLLGHLRTAPRGCLCANCGALVALELLRRERQERLSPTASTCSTCGVTLTQHDAIGSRQVFGRALCPRHQAHEVHCRLRATGDQLEAVTAEIDSYCAKGA